MITNLFAYFLCFCLAQIGTGGLAQDSDYCAFSPEHTLCKYQGTDVESCGTVLGSGVDPSHIHEILHSHNGFRSLIASGAETRGAPGPQPSASNMKQLVWDWELAGEAQRLAEQCRFQHDCPDCRTVARFDVGQNLYQSWQNVMDSEINWNEAVKAWYDEVDIFNNSIAEYYEFQYETGHYTQLVWATTEYVGCGYSFYLKDGLFHKLYVCNYGPTGNYLTLPLYEFGTPCSQCPENTECSPLYKGLCTSKNAPVVVSNNSLASDVKPRNVNIETESIVKTTNNDLEILSTQSTDFTTNNDFDTTVINDPVTDYVFIVDSVSLSKLQTVLQTFASLLSENQTLHYYESGTIFANNDIWSKLCVSKST